MPADTTTELDVVFGIDFFLENSIWELINNKIKDHASGTTVFSNETTLKDLGELIVDKKDRAKFVSRTSATDKLPSELAKTFMFTDVHLFWNKKTRSLQHSGTVGILSMNGKLYNRSANMKMEITRKRSGDAVQIYIEFDSNNWYYFNYRNNIMQILTSHTTEINNKIVELDAGKRTVEGKNGVPNYQFTLQAGKRQFEQWLEKF